MVVYLSIPTSNHNKLTFQTILQVLFICLFLHQTTTVRRAYVSTLTLFICLFLHQTTTLLSCWICRLCCLSVYSYIKPQHSLQPLLHRVVVYLSIPTSNHNLFPNILTTIFVVYLSIPTSNHNYVEEVYEHEPVVYLSIPTSNHNKVEVDGKVC